VDLQKPLGLKFARGADGGAYVVANDPRAGNTDDRVQPGDKVVEISASFGTDVWKAENYGQIMYAIRTRNGSVYLKLKKNYGDLSSLDEDGLTPAEKAWKTERRGGNYGAGTKEVQARNYVARKEAERKRRELFDDALVRFKQGDVEGALVDFENVVAMEPRNFVGDNLARVTAVLPVALYNVACCYSMVDNADEGAKSLRGAFEAGFEDFKKARADPNLAKLRASPKFRAVIDQYDEPVFDMSAIEGMKNALGGLFKRG